MRRALADHSCMAPTLGDHPCLGTPTASSRSVAPTPPERTRRRPRRRRRAGKSSPGSGAPRIREILLGDRSHAGVGSRDGGPQQLRPALCTQEGDERRRLVKNEEARLDELEKRIRERDAADDREDGTSIAGREEAPGGHPIMTTVTASPCALCGESSTSRLSRPAGRSTGDLIRRRLVLHHRDPA